MIDNYSKAVENIKRPFPKLASVFCLLIFPETNGQQNLFLWGTITHAGDCGDT